MEAATCDLVDTRGDDVIVTLEFVDEHDVAQDLTGIIFAAQLRVYPNDTTAVSFDVDDDNLATGVLVLSIPHATAQTLGRTYAWDLQATDGGDVSTWLRGTFTFDEDATR